MTPSNEHAARAYLMLATAGLCWSGTHVVARAMAGHVPPIGAALVRWAVPSVLLLAVAWPYLKRDWPLIKRHWPVLVLLGIPGGIIFSALQHTGMIYTTVMNASIMNSMSPVLIVAAGALVFRDRIGIAQVIGVAISLAGVMVVVTRGNFEVLAGLKFNKGDLILLANQMAWAVYSACIRLRPPIHWLSFLYIICLLSTVGLIPVYYIEHASGFTIQPTVMTAWALLYMAIFPGMVAFACWNMGVEAIGANRAGVFMHLIPIYSTTLAYFLLGEQLQAYHAVGFVTILTGVAIAARLPRR